MKLLLYNIFINSRLPLIDIIARSDTCLCCFCFLTVHAAALPVNPIWYALMKCREWLMKQWMTSVGQALKFSSATTFASTYVFFWNCNTVSVLYPILNEVINENESAREMYSTISTRLSSQWNFGRRMHSCPAFLIRVSRSQALMALAGDVWVFWVHWVA